MVSSLTQNAIKLINTADNYDTFPGMEMPLLQLLNAKRLPNQERFRLLVSDGAFYMNAMAAATLNAQFEQGILDKECIIRVKQYSVSEVNGRKIMIIFDMELAEPPKNGKIGNPVNINTILNGVENAAPQKPQPSTATASPAQPKYNPPGQFKPNNNNQQQFAQKSATKSNNNGTMVETETAMPIKVLNPYNNNWTIKARVSNKSEMRTWANAKGEGRLFSVTLIDNSAEIKATAFNEHADKFFPILEDNHVYMISNGQVKIARKQFNNVQNDYEISFDRTTHIVPVADTGNVPTIRYNFVSFQNLANYQKDSTVDVIAVVKDVSEIQQITAKTTQRQMVKRDVTLVDQSNTTVRLTIWGKQAETLEVEGNPVIVAKGVRVSDYNGVSLNTSAGSSVALNPDIPEAYPLRAWFDQGGALSNNVNDLSNRASKKAGGAISERKYLSSIQNEDLGQNEKPDYITVRAYTTNIKSDRNLWYTACPGENCSKKVIQDGDGYRCEKCARTYDYCEYRYIMGLNASDSTGSAWLNCFNETAEMILGHPASELNQYKETGNEDAFNAVFHEAAFKEYIFRLRIKQEIYNEEMRVRSTIVSADSVNYAQEAKYLADLIESYNN